MSLQTLLETKAIECLKARYLRCADTKQWEALSDCFCDDIVCDFRGATTDPVSGQHLLPGSDMVLSGRDQVMSTIIAALDTVPSIHAAFLPEIELLSETDAKGIWAMTDKLYIGAGDDAQILVGYGHYHETYQKLEGRWKIKSLRLVRLKVETA